MAFTISRKSIVAAGFFLALAVLFCTYLRVSLLFVYPLLVAVLFIAFRWKLHRNALLLTGWMMLCWLLSLRHGLYLKYNLVSFYYFIPFVALLFAVPRMPGGAISSGIGGPQPDSADALSGSADSGAGLQNPQPGSQDFSQQKPLPGSQDSRSGSHDPVTDTHNSDSLRPIADTQRPDPHDPIAEAQHPGSASREPSLLTLLMGALTAIAILNDLIGIAQYIRLPGDDNFVGLYGSFTVSQNGLSVLNGILFAYHLFVYLHRRRGVNLLLFLFFLVCAVMGFYGAGQLMLIIALLLTLVKIRHRNIIKLAFIAAIVASFFMLIMKMISPLTLDYNLAIIGKFLDPSAPGAPRKLTVFKNYVQAYPPHTADFLIGSGPGTFNSRSAFMVGSPSYFNVDLIKSEQQPDYFRDYAYTLWNSTNTGPYDGFMNQPFSSLLALLGEYGLIFTLLLALAWMARFRSWSRRTAGRAKAAGVPVEAWMYRFCTFFILLMITIDNYIEYPETIGLLLIILQLSYQQTQKAFYQEG